LNEAILAADGTGYTWLCGLPIYETACIVLQYWCDDPPDTSASCVQVGLQFWETLSFCEKLWAEMHRGVSIWGSSWVVCL